MFLEPLDVFRVRIHRLRSSTMAWRYRNRKRTWPCTGVYTSQLPVIIVIIIKTSLLMARRLSIGNARKINVDIELFQFVVLLVFIDYML